MQNLLRLIPILSLFVFTNTSLAANNHNKLKLVREITDLSGIDKQISSVQEIIVQQANAALSKDNKIPQQEKVKIAKIMNSEFSSKRLILNIEKNIEKSLSKAELKELIKFYKQEKILQISRLEESANTPEGIKKVQAYAQKIRTTPPEKKRILMVNDLDVTVGSTEFTLNVLTKIIKTMSKVLEGKEISEEQLAIIKSQIAQQIKNTNLIYMLYTYQTVSDKDLSNYINSYKKNNLLMKVSNITIQEMDNEFSRWALNISKKLKKMLPKKKTEGKKS